MTGPYYGPDWALRLQENRKRELQLLAESRATADVRYVQSAVDFLWGKCFERKVKQRAAMPPEERRRLNTLLDLVA
jgi:hypothetical protein